MAMKVDPQANNDKIRMNSGSRTRKVSGALASGSWLRLLSTLTFTSGACAGNYSTRWDTFFTVM